MNRPVCILVLLWAALMFLFGGDAAAEHQWRIRAGSDVIGERFYLVDDDTLDLSTEYRIQLQNLWRYEGDTWSDVTLDNRVGIGTLSARYDLDFEATRELTPDWALELDGLTAYRHYIDDANGVRSNFSEGRLETVMRRTAGKPYSWGVEQGGEWLRYSDPSTVFLDAYRHWHGFTVDGGRGFDFYGASIAGDHEIVPDSTGLGFWGVVADGYGMHSLAPSIDVSADGALYLRHYNDTASHPHQVEIDGTGRLGWRMDETWSIEPSLGVTWTSYSPADSVYYDLTILQPAIELLYWPLWGQLRAGPLASFQRSSTLRSEAFDQWGGRVGATLFSGDWGFLDATVIVGRRNYRYDDEAIFSDYWYWDGTIVLNTHLPWEIDLDTFVLIRTEDHRDSGDNSTSVLLTVNLSRRVD